MTLQMHNPPRPGQIIRELCLEPLGLSVTEAAEGLGVNGEKDEQEPSGGETECRITNRFTCHGRRSRLLQGGNSRASRVVARELKR